MTLLALANLPNGVKLGETFETNAVVGKILIVAGVARAIATDPTDDGAPKPKRSYKRRDLTPEP